MLDVKRQNHIQNANKSGFWDCKAENQAISYNIILQTWY